MRQKHVMVGAGVSTVVWVVAGVCVYGLWVRGCRTDRSRVIVHPSAAPQVEAFDADILQLSRTYDTSERGKRRGKAFAKLVMLAVTRQFNGTVHTRDDILRLFGDPDLTLAGQQVEWFAYFYDQAGYDDAVVYVYFDSKGVVSHFGFNASSVNDHGPPWRPYAGPGKGQK
jgi:hypothetical protein